MMRKVDFGNTLINRSFEFSIQSLKLIRNFNNDSSNRVIINQFIRSATSIGANLVESRNSTTTIEFKRFNEISLKSANETKYWLMLLLELNSNYQKEILILSKELEEISKMIAAGIIKIKKKI